MLFAEALGIALVVDDHRQARPGRLIPAVDDAVARRQRYIFGAAQRGVGERNDRAGGGVLQGALVDIHVTDDAGIGDSHQGDDGDQETAQQLHVTTSMRLCSHQPIPAWTPVSEFGNGLFERLGKDFVRLGAGEGVFLAENEEGNAADALLGGAGGQLRGDG